MNKFKKVLLVALFMLSVFALNIDAKLINNCYQALMGCLDDCNNMPPPLNYACATGCNIGYLNCIY